MTRKPTKPQPRAKKQSPSPTRDDRNKTYEPQIEQIKQRLDLFGLNISAAADQTGFGLVTMKRLLSARSAQRRYPTVTELIELSRLFRLSIPATLKLLNISGAFEPKARLIGHADTNGRVELLPPDNPKHIEAPESFNEAERELQAVSMSTPATAGGVFTDAIFYFTRMESIAPTAMRYLSFLTFHSSANPEIGIPVESMDRKFKITSLNGSGTRVVNDLSSASRILWIKNS